MALLDKSPKKWANPNRRKAFQVAFDGFRVLWRDEINFRIHLGLSILVILFGIIVGLSVVEWLLVMIAIGMVISAEIINTALEHLVDLIVGQEWHSEAKLIKDIGALVVLFNSLLALLLGLVIFLPHILRIFWAIFLAIN